MKYIVGIDADGTIFDTMNIKHKEVFWQCMMERWSVPDPDGKILLAAEKINLYSKSRGVNRFPGLLSVMEICPTLSSLDKSPLANFIKSGYPLSNKGLQKYIDDGHDDKLLLDVLAWSNDIDRVFAEKTEGLMPFEGASIAIRKMADTVEVVIVSSASGAILERDLDAAGLSGCITKIMGQECGKKHEQLEAVKASLNPDKVLMIGDAISDCDAAKRAGAYFYPIVPGSEENSWQQFLDKYFDIFTSSESFEPHEDKLYKEFLAVFEN